MGTGIAIGIVLGIIIVIILILLGVSLRIVPQAHVYIIERLGSYKGTWEHGIHFLFPFIDRISLKESLKERVLDFPAQDVITKDNVTMKIDTVVYMQIIDAKLYAYGVDRPLFAIENLSATTLRNLVGELELDQTLTSRETVNERLRLILDEASDPWGIKVHRVELKNILPPEDIQRAMEKQMRAERGKRQIILEAEGEKASMILRAEGERESNIIRAEGIRMSTIKQAEGKAQSISLIKNADPNKQVLMMKSYEAIKDLANGTATKIIIPPNLADIASIAATFSGVLDPSPKTKKTSQTKKDKPNLSRLIKESRSK